MSKLYTNIPICVPTKGRHRYQDRPDGTRVYSAAILSNLYNYCLEHPESFSRCFMMIEKEELEQYHEAFPEWPLENILVLGDSNQGIGFSRGSILRYFQNRGDEAFMMLDDDCKLVEVEYGYSEKKGCEIPLLKNKPVIELVDHICEYISGFSDEDMERVGVVSMEYIQFAWNKMPALKREPTHKYQEEYTDLGYADCAIMLFPQKLLERDVMYDNFKLKEDRDFCAQVYASGLINRKLFRFQMDSPLNGKAPGGLHAVYKVEGFEHNEVMRVIDKWNGEHWQFPENFYIEDRKVKCDDPAAQAYYDNKYLKSNKHLAVFKPKKTSYNRVSDVKLFWVRIKMAYEGKLKQFPDFKKPEPYFINPKINDVTTAKDYLEKDAE